MYYLKMTDLSKKWKGKSMIASSVDIYLIHNTQSARKNDQFYPKAKRK